MAAGRRWTILDRYGNTVYLTDERWHHIIGAMNHPEMACYEEHLKETIQSGQRPTRCPQPAKIPLCPSACGSARGQHPHGRNRLVSVSAG
jgi:hypothetical protein